MNYAVPMNTIATIILCIFIAVVVLVTLVVLLSMATAFINLMAAATALLEQRALQVKDDQDRGAR